MNSIYFCTTHLVSECLVKCAVRELPNAGETATPAVFHWDLHSAPRGISTGSLDILLLLFDTLVRFCPGVLFPRSYFDAVVPRGRGRHIRLPRRASLPYVPTREFASAFCKEMPSAWDIPRTHTLAFTLPGAQYCATDSPRFAQ